MYIKLDDTTIINTSHMLYAYKGIIRHAKEYNVGHERIQYFINIKYQNGCMHETFYSSEEERDKAFNDFCGLLNAYKS